MKQLVKVITAVTAVVLFVIVGVLCLGYLPATYHG